MKTPYFPTFNQRHIPKQKEIPADTFAPGLKVDVGDMIDLLRKDEGFYEVRICVGKNVIGMKRNHFVEGDI